MNSPLVKGETLNFKDAGVMGIVKDVFIPWFNVYRFMLQNISRWEMDSGKTFTFNESLFENLDKFTNIMDRWIIATNQDLVKFVRKELESYRLYTVVQKKVQFLEILSNWYLRLNRHRIKGSVSEEDSYIA